MAPSLDDLRRLPTDLWGQIRTDPIHAPERIALAAAARHAPTAQAWVDERRADGEADPKRLAKLVKKRHATLARLGGAATGMGGFATVVPDLAALAWIQSRQVIFLAAAYGLDPRDPMRPAELLHLMGLYDSPQAARDALDGVGPSPTSAWIDQRLSKDEALTRRLLKMAGKRVGGRFAGRLIPGVAVVVNAAGNERETRRLADEAIAFYAGRRS